MNILGLTISLLGCSLITYSDFKKRHIHLISILILFGGVMLMEMFGNYSLYTITAINISLLFVFLAILRLYIFMRKGWKERFINRYLGSGDVIILFVFCFSYGTLNYILFIIMSCVVGLLASIVYRLKNKNIKLNIPLAGIMTLIHIPVIIYSEIASFDLMH